MLRYFADRLFSPASLPTSTPGAAAKDWFDNLVDVLPQRVGVLRLPGFVSALPFLAIADMLFCNRALATSKAALALSR